MTHRENKALAFLFPLITAILFVIIASFFVFQITRLSTFEMLSEDNVVSGDFMTWFTGTVIGGDYGDSPATRKPVSELITERLESTSELLILSMLVSALWAIPIGTLLAYMRRKALDGLLRPLVIFGVAMPFLWLALVWILDLGINQGIVPIAGRCPMVLDGCPPLAERMEYIILPLYSLIVVWANAAALGIRQAILNFFQANQIESPKFKDYIIGLLYGILSGLPFLFAGLFSHLIIVESIFSQPGIGHLVIAGAVQRDYAVVTAIIMWSVVNAALLYAICGILRASLMAISGMIMPSHLVTQYALIALPSQPDDTIQANMPSRSIFSQISTIVVLLTAFWLGTIAFSAFTNQSADPNQQDIKARLSEPSTEHPMGTDDLGRDMYARVLAGTQTSLSISLSTAISATIIGGVLGLIAGSISGKIGRIINLLLDSLLSTFYLFPLLIIAYLLTSNTPGQGFVIAFTLIAIPLVILIVRASVWQVQTASMKSKRKSKSDEDATDYDRKPVNRGAITLATIGYCLALVTVMTLLLGAMLDFMGLGIQPPQASLGALLSGYQRFLQQAPNLVIQPGIILLELSLGLWIIAEFLRSRFQLAGYD